MAKKKPNAAHKGLPRSTVIASSVAIVFIGLTTFSLLKWTGSHDTAAALRIEIDEAAATEAELREELAPLAAQYDRLKGRTDVLGIGKLTVCNSSDERITISQVASIYYNDESSEFQIFNSQKHGHGLWSLEPGEVRELSFPSAGWDGSVTYYALFINDLVPYGGVWPLKAGHCIRHTGS